MIKLYDILKAKKTGFSDSIFTTMFANKLSEPIATEKELEDAPPLSFSANGQPLVAYRIEGNISQAETPASDSPVYMSGCGNLVSTGEHSGEYVITITNNNITTPIYTNEPLRKIGQNVDYKSESEEYRVIKEMVLTGEEDWKYDGTNFYLNISSMNDPVVPNSALYCSHFPNSSQGIRNGTNWAFITLYSGAANKTEWQAWLAAQYAANTPVTVWYILATPTTQSIAAPAIPTAKGSNTLSVETTVQPSSVYIKYKE